MNPDELMNFMKNEMIMQDGHNYQPVMIRTLNKNDGKASKLKIMEELQKENSEHPISFFRKCPVFDVLTDKHPVARYDENNDMYYLLDYETYSAGKKSAITKLCEAKMDSHESNDRSFSGKQIETFEELSRQFIEWKKSKQGKNIIKNHTEHINYLQDKLSKQNIKKITENDIVDIYKILWANNNFSNKEYRAKLALTNGIEKIRNELSDLLYGSDSLIDRYDKCDKNLKHMRNSTLTEFLYCLDQKKYCLWNGASDEYFKNLGIDRIIGDPKSDGKKYQKTIDVLSKVLEITKPFGITDFFDLDIYFNFRLDENTLPNISRADPDKIEFWQVAAGEDEKYWDEFKRTSTIGVGWNNIGDIAGLADDEIKVKFKDAGYEKGLSSLQKFMKIKPNDIVFVNKGKRGILAIGEVVGNYEYNTNSTYYHAFPVRWLSTDYLPVRGPWSGNKTVDRIKNKDAVSKYIPKMAKQITPFDGIFEDHKQILLYGPPGTSKTRTAKEIAIEHITKGLVKTNSVDEIFDNLIESGYVEIVQFHPSYSYEDFVEGIRPVSDNKNKKIIYEVQDGIFKKICKLAYETYFDETDHRYAIITNYVKFDPIDPKKFGLSAQQGGIHRLNKSDFEKIIQHLKNNDIDVLPFEKTDSFSSFLTLNSSEESIYTDVEGFWYHFSKDANAPVLMKESIENGDTAFVYYKKKKGFAGVGTIKKNALVLNPEYFLIIDEINRGDPARIFGELIYGLEYRGRLIKTQYSEFDQKNTDHMIIPENLYIIGTMNTADRSISLFDVALRRRFASKGLFPDYKLLSNELGFNGLPDVQARFSKIDNESRDNQTKILSILAMKKINDKITDPHEFKLGRERQIGHTYFLRLKKNPNKFVNTWKYDVVPLLEEFFYAKTKDLERLFTEKIFSEKEGVKNFTEDQLIASLKSLISEQSV